jgi:CheY-like chemotaxis protein
VRSNSGHEPTDAGHAIALEQSAGLAARHARLRARSFVLRAELAAAVQQSRALCSTSLELRLTSRRRIRGSSDGIEGSRAVDPAPTRTILIVEDEADFLTTYDRLLRRQGMRMIGVGTMHAALLALESDTPDLIITDLRLPDGDGLAVVRAARARSRATPVIVVTGLVSDRSRRQAVEAGATAFLVKPFSMLTLVALIRETLSRASS